MAIQGFHYCAQAFSSCSELGLLFFAVPRLLIVVASRAAPALGAETPVVAPHGAE